ncbi:hypothetical protein GQ55_3G085400 [Panicum hallii var. hallii]|uniref:Uncharacterized protein n=1 Tax=Panicum hallii var. hallii TaxID=1504633 RepID=A0A2T7E736_9POAL|nr:hypothetical protein GQ55_3G085400 [Panicum hallii var. hallii]
MTLEYINKILMEEDIDETASIYQEPDALQATEKPFYDILGQTYPSSAKETVMNSDSRVDCPDDSSNNYREGACSGSFINDFLGPWGDEQANKFVAIIEKLAVDLDSSELAVSKQMTDAIVTQKGKHVNKIRSHPHMNLELLDARNSKHLAISCSETIRDETFDSVLLCTGQLYCDAAHLREMKEKEARDSSQIAQSKKYGQGQLKSRAKKQQEEMIDLRALLIQCAQAIASNNQPFDRELLTKIRNHSSPYGDGSQRLANYFVDALEARVAGTGSQMYQKLMAKRKNTTDMLKAYRLFIAACPFANVAYYYSNQTIVDVLVGQPTVHIIDFGITFGFQWPSLIQRFANREGGPPNLRITGIDVPEPGFRLCKKIEETGTKRMNPEVLIIGVVNGLYNSPFFLPRFREVLFYYSSLFDMINSTVARSHEARILIERDLLGADVFNVVACEGAERIEKPESYKQWQARILKAGFKQLPVNQTILKGSIIERKKELYHEDFVVDEDSGWLLQGWKGRIMHALSSWKPKESYSNQ